MVNVNRFNGKISKREKETVLKILQSKVKNQILSRMLGVGDMSKTVLILDVYNNKSAGISDRVLEILSETLEDTMDLSPENIEQLSSMIAALLLQEIVSGNTNISLISRLEEMGYMDIALKYKKSLYFSYDFLDIVRIMVQTELRHMEGDIFILLENDRRSIFDFGEDEDSIVTGISELFFERFQQQAFNVSNILHLGISGFDNTALEEAKKQVVRERKTIRI